MSLAQTVPDLVGIDGAKELTCTGRTVSGAEARELGLVTPLRGSARGRPVARARDRAEFPDAIRAAKRLLNESFRADATTGLALEAELQQELLGSPNQAAAVQSALGGSPPNFVDPA